MPPRTRKTARKSTGPIGIPRHQLAPRHEESSSGNNDPIGDLEAQVEQLRMELCHRNMVWVEDGQRINELRPDVRHMQDELAEQDLALDWAANSRSIAWDREAKARARVDELSTTVDNLHVYFNTLHEEVHELYSRLHLDVPADPVGMGARASGTVGEALGGELDLFKPPPSMNPADERSPTTDSEATKDDKY
jgi:chromosome segregation ATPase